LRELPPQKRELERQSLKSLVGHLRDGKLCAVTEDDVSTALSLCQQVARAAHLLPGDYSCLVQALLAQGYLQSQGISGRLLVGVRSGAEHMPLDAHAWIECDGRVVLGEREGEDYASLVSYTW